MPTEQLSAWQNQLPTSILEADSYRALRAGERRTLQGIANGADRTPAGHLVGCRGGPGLLKAIGCSRRTFWKHLARLERLGFVVTLTRGGNRPGHLPESNTYGIPAEPGGLDQFRAQRERRVSVRDGETTTGQARFVPQTIESGEQLMLWRAEPASDRAEDSADGSRTPCRNDTGPVQKRHGPRAETTRDPCRNCTPPSPYHPSPSSIHHGISSGASRQRGKKKWLRNVKAADLTNTDRLLALHRRAVEERVVSDSQDHLLIFVTLAERAERRRRTILYAASFDANGGLFEPLYTK